MIDKEVAELRRRYRQDREQYHKIHGCYVSTCARRALSPPSPFSMGLLPEGDRKISGAAEKGISGRMGKPSPT